MWFLLALALALGLLSASSALAYPPAIGRANLDGSDPDFSFIADDAAWLAGDSQHLYWANADESSFFGAGNSIGRANVDGSGVDPTFISDPGGSVYGVAVDSAHIYWVRAGQDARDHDRAREPRRHRG